jgi:predicted methyltransferase
VQTDRAVSRLFVVTLGLAMVATGACRARSSGPNDAYLDPRVSADDWNRLFTAPDREVYEKREKVLRLAAVRPGMSVADVGAGTGVFSMMLSDAVGEKGRVYAEEVLVKFSRYIAEAAERERKDNVLSVVGTDRSIGLPPDSIDMAFLCDVYHHFDHPREMLASIRSSLHADGEVFLVEFRREPTSPAWVFEHIRADEAQVVREFEVAGFGRRSRDDSFRDSYVVRFALAGRAAASASADDLRKGSP